MSLVADETIRQLFITRGHSERDDIDSMSSGSVPPDLGDTWHQGLPMNPQWEGGLELNSDNDCEDENEYQDDGSFEEFDSDPESGPKDYIGEASESSLWASIRDYLTPPDILVLRTAGSKWNNAKFYGEFAALWFFLMTKDGSEWPSTCSDYRPNFVFGNGGFEPGRLPDLTALGDSGVWT